MEGLPVAAGIKGGGAALEVLGDAPLIGVDPLDDPGAAQRLQPAHMGIDEALIIAARNAALKLRLFQMTARSIDAILVDGGNGPVGWSLRRVGRADLDDAADPGILDASRSEEHTSELQYIMRTSYAVSCSKKKITHK